MIKQIRETVKKRIDKRGVQFADALLSQCSDFAELTDESPFAQAFSAAL